MADPPDYCAAHTTGPTIIGPPQLDVVGAEGPETSNTNIIATQTNATPYSNTNATVVENSSAAVISSTRVNDIRLTLKPNAATQQSSTATYIHQRSDAAREEHAAVSTESSPSLFAELPGEIRNRIYRAYFEDFREQK